jgi:hypothetical protein
MDSLWRQKLSHLRLQAANGDQANPVCDLDDYPHAIIKVRGLLNGVVSRLDWRLCVSPVRAVDAAEAGAAGRRRSGVLERGGESPHAKVSLAHAQNRGR